MKITDIKNYLVSDPRDLHFVKIETDEGIYGLGEAGCSTREYAQEGAVRHFREFLIGMDPMRIEHIWQILYRGAYFEGGRILTAAMSAIDMALYDIVGKKLGVPVYQLLGGACRDRIYTFITTGSVSDPDCLAKAREAVKEGYPAVRVGPARKLPGRDKNSEALYEVWPSIAETAEAFTELYENLDRSVPLGIDYHHRLSVAEAASFCGKIPAGSLAFLEEPIRAENPESYAALRQMTDVPFAVGEEFSSKWAFLPFIERGLTNYIRVDVCCVGGLTEAKKVAGWSEAHYIDLMPHNPIGPVCTAASVHLAAACNNFSWLELNPLYNEHPKDLFPVMPERKGPYFPLPVRPGLGVEIDEGALDKHTFVIREHPHLMRQDGSYTNW